MEWAASMTEQTAPVPDPVVADRAVGAVLGSAAGDALGAHYEFGPPLPADASVDMIGGGAFGWAPGEWTDDTQMALAILGVLATGSTDTGEVEAAFRRWYDSGPADVGVQTRAVLSRPGALAEVARRRYEAHQPRRLATAR
jgi:ADP-ribosylglycohydrolase